MSTLTLTGEDGDVITLDNASVSTSNMATQLVNQLNSEIANGTAVINNMNTGGIRVNDSTNVIFYLTKGYINLDLQRTDDLKYFVIGEAGQTADDGPITLHTDTSALITSDNLTILSSRNSVVNFYTDKTSGHFINTAGTLNFQATQTTNEQGDWQIDSGDGNDTIVAGNGFNTINAGLGNNMITVGNGNNMIHSIGHDTITATGIGVNSITLSGGSSQVSTIGMAVIVNDSENNSINVGNNTTISSGSNSTITFDGTKNTTANNSSSRNEVQLITNSTITGVHNVDLYIIQGSNNNFNVNGSLTIYNGSGISNATINGSGTVFGANNLDFNLNSDVNASISGSSLFVAGAGNETLNAVNYHNSLKIYANTISGSVANLVATGTSNGDLMAAGIGNSTFTGGSGNNVFLFSKTSDAGGTTVITDFSQSVGNQILLANYGFNSNDVTQILQNATTDSSGSAILNLGNHQITLQNVAASDLKISQFNFIG